MLMPVVRKAERGYISVEFTLSLPLLVFTLMLLLGLGHVLITKQHAIVGAQFASHYRRTRLAAPAPAAVSRAVSDGAEKFRLTPKNSSPASLGYGYVKEGTVGYVARTTPERGILVRMVTLNDAAAQYETVIGTGACNPNGDQTLTACRIYRTQ